MRPCRHLDIEDLWHMEGDVDWVKCRKAFVNGELQCPPDAIKQIRGDGNPLLLARPRGDDGVIISSGITPIWYSHLINRRFATVLLRLVAGLFIRKGRSLR